MFLNLFQPDADADGLSVMPCSEGSEEEASEEELPITSWNELSIIERVGLSSEEMSEKDLESAFSQIALAFRSDQYTLKQRLQAEEHARNLAEENIQLELTRGRETLETLKGLCLDSKRSKILQRLQLSLDILSGTVERISNTAEVLGAVHQEARVSRAVELMVAHVENLKRRLDRSAAALTDAKTLLQQQESSSHGADPGTSSGSEVTEEKAKGLAQNSLRRRVSIIIISSHTQDKKKSDGTKEEGSPIKSPGACTPSPPSPEPSGSADDRTLDPEETSDPPEAAAQLPAVTSPSHGNTERLSSGKKCKDKTPNKSPNKKSDVDKKKNPPRTPANACGSLWRRRPLLQWLHCCRWLLLGVYLLIVLAAVTLICYLWKPSDEALKL
ncbi:inositol 1,4,5-triphosphate receptor associated 2 isoform X2 [Betta splendens]|uniref:Inositol 1,4,5-triphosphate receptor associated 2 isoform X2 n=1 Tax=Betta splendens TaxID=158456 RepID=A0A6P7N524_BETSP|nr:inositol 1,4,5-triphosphate receptor associated 2 isoform X2 [Betta splendens]